MAPLCQVLGVMHKLCPETRPVDLYSIRDSFNPATCKVLKYLVTRGNHKSTMTQYIWHREHGMPTCMALLALLAGTRCAWPRHPGSCSPPHNACSGEGAVLPQGTHHPRAGSGLDSCHAAAAHQPAGVAGHVHALPHCDQGHQGAAQPPGAEGARPLGGARRGGCLCLAQL